MVWVPAKEAAVPNLLPRARLETADQLALVTTYGVTPVLAALVFAGLARLPRLGGRLEPTGVALLFDTLTFLASGVVGTAKFYAGSLGGGDATFAILFAALFARFGGGIVAGPRLVGQLSRRRWFAMSIVLAGAAVAALSVAPRLTNAALCAAVVGALGVECPGRCRLVAPSALTAWRHSCA